MKRIKWIGMMVCVLGIAAAAIFYDQWFWSYNERVSAAFAETTCPEISPRMYPGGSYIGPLWDTHMHIAPIPDGPRPRRFSPEDQAHIKISPILGVNITVHDIVCAFKTEGTERVFMFFPVWDPIPEPLIKIVQRAVTEYPDQFVPFIMPPQADNDPNGFPTVDAATLESLLALAPGLFQGYGEIGLYAREGGAAELPPDSERMLAIYSVLQKYGLPAYVHLGRGQGEALASVADLFPDVQFIFHGDQLVQGQHNNPDLSAIERLLTEHPNITYGIDELYGDVWLLRPEISKEEFFAHFEDTEKLLEYDLRVWEPFILRHPDQVIWGTDRGAIARWTMDRDVGLQLTSYARAFIGRLPVQVQKKFAFQNAQRILRRATGE